MAEDDIQPSKPQQEEEIPPNGDIGDQLESKITGGLSDTFGKEGAEEIGKELRKKIMESDAVKNALRNAVSNPEDEEEVEETKGTKSKKTRNTRSGEKDGDSKTENTHPQTNNNEVEASQLSENLSPQDNAPIPTGATEPNTEPQNKNVPPKTTTSKAGTQMMRNASTKNTPLPKNGPQQNTESEAREIPKNKAIGNFDNEAIENTPEETPDTDTAIGNNNSNTALYPKEQTEGAEDPYIGNNPLADDEGEKNNGNETAKEGENKTDTANSPKKSAEKASDDSQTDIEEENGTQKKNSETSNDEENGENGVDDKAKKPLTIEEQEGAPIDPLQDNTLTDENARKEREDKKNKNKEEGQQDSSNQTDGNSSQKEKQQSSEQKKNREAAQANALAIEQNKARQEAATNDTQKNKERLSSKETDEGYMGIRSVVRVALLGFLRDTFFWVYFIIFIIPILGTLLNTIFAIITTIPILFIIWKNMSLSARTFILKEIAIYWEAYLIAFSISHGFTILFIHSHLRVADMTTAGQAVKKKLTGLIPTKPSSSK